MPIPESAENFLRYELAPVRSTNSSSAIAVCSDRTNNVVVGWRDAQGGITIAKITPTAVSSNQVVAAGALAFRGHLALASRRTGGYLLAWVAGDGSLMAWEETQSGESPVVVAPAASASPVSGIRSVSGEAGDVELYWVTPGGAVNGATSRRRGAPWCLTAVAPHGSAKTASDLACVTIPVQSEPRPSHRQHTQLWWRGQDMSVRGATRLPGDSWQLMAPIPVADKGGYALVDATYIGQNSVAIAHNLGYNKLGGLLWSGYEGRSFDIPVAVEPGNFSAVSIVAQSPVAQDMKETALVQVTVGKVPGRIITYRQTRPTGWQTIQHPGIPKVFEYSGVQGSAPALDVWTRLELHQSGELRWSGTVSGSVTTSIAMTVTLVLTPQSGPAKQFSRRIGLSANSPEARWLQRYKKPADDPTGQGAAIFANLKDHTDGNVVVQVSTAPA